MTAYALRAATPADSEDCFRIHRAGLGPYVEAVWGWDDEVQRGFHDRSFDPARTRLVLVDGAVAGLLIVHDGPTAVDLARIELDPAYQGRGIGAAIIGDVMAEAASRRLPVTLEVLVVNGRAHALYRRLGFQEIGRDDTKIRMRADPQPA